VSYMIHGGFSLEGEMTYRTIPAPYEAELTKSDIWVINPSHYGQTPQATSGQKIASYLALAALGIVVIHLITPAPKR